MASATFSLVLNAPRAPESIKEPPPNTALTMMLFVCSLDLGYNSCSIRGLFIWLNCWLVIVQCRE